MKRIVESILVKFLPDLYASRFMQWLGKLSGEDKVLAREFIRARITDLAGIRVMHVSAIGNLIARNMYVDLLAIVEGTNISEKFGMNLVEAERKDVFMAIAVHVESAVELGRSIREYESKKQEDRTPRDEWILKRDKLYLQHILGA